METSQVQQNQEPMDANSAAASLAFATQLQQQMMPKNEQVNGGTPTEVPQEPESAPGKAETPEPQEDMMKPHMDEMEGKFAEFGKKVKEIVKNGIEEIKKMLGKEEIKEE